MFSRSLQGPDSHYKPYSKHFFEVLEFSRVFLSFLVFYGVLSCLIEFSRGLEGQGSFTNPIVNRFWRGPRVFLCFLEFSRVFLRFQGLQGHPRITERGPKVIQRAQRNHKVGLQTL